MNLCVTPGERKPVCVFDAQECLWSSVNLSNYEWFSMNADKWDLCEFSRKMKAFVLFFHSAKKTNLAFNWFSTKTWSDISHIVEQKWSRSEWMDVQYWLQKNPGSNWLPFKKPELLSRHTKSFIFVNVSLWPQLLYWWSVWNIITLLIIFEDLWY